MTGRSLSRTLFSLSRSLALLLPGSEPLSLAESRSLSLSLALLLPRSEPLSLAESRSLSLSRSLAPSL